MDRKTWTNADYDEFERMMHGKFPKMFAEPYGGFAIEPGWWEMIHHLCSQIQAHIDHVETMKNVHGIGEGCNQVVVEQIKEKFGTLRFYATGGNDYTDGLITMAESMSGILCEQCGAPGERRHGGWIRTLCDEHEAERQAQKQAAKEW
jgi:hypothetical protein